MPLGFLILDAMKAWRMLKDEESDESMMIKMMDDQDDG